jgi:TRAP-type mannitol/chloroaromatic compound transport system permease small subunit
MLILVVFNMINEHKKFQSCVFIDVFYKSYESKRPKENNILRNTTYTMPMIIFSIHNSIVRFILQRGDNSVSS